MPQAQVKDVMTTNVITVRKSTSYKQIAAQLNECRVSAFPVLDDDGTVIGVVSAADLLAKEAFTETEDSPHPWLSGVRHRRELEKAHGLAGADLMTAPAVTVGPNASVRHAAQLMSDRRVKQLPVVGADGRLAGMISRADVLAVFRRPDEDIQREITRDIIADGYFMDPACFKVTVKDGIVTLEDSPGTEAVGYCVAEQVRHMDGVVAVRERRTGTHA